MSVEGSRHRSSLELLPSADNPGPSYDREPTFSSIARDIDVMVPMRDGVKICVDVYRPEASGKFPALLAFAIYNKDFQGPDMAAALPPQPAWSPLWTGPLEAGDTKFLVSRGYVHVIGSPRGVGKSEGGGSREWDCYDLIEWIAAQDWCDGNVGMVGISGFGAEQLAVAKKQPPHLKAIFPFDSARRLWRIRRLPRRISRRRHSSVPLSGRPFLGDASAQGVARRLAGGTGIALARRHEQSRLQNVPARLQSDRAKRPAHAALLQCAGRSVRFRSGGAEKRGGVRTDQGADLYRFRLVRLHL